MGKIVNFETDEVLFESPDPSAIREKADELGEQYAAENGDKAVAPYRVEGFDAIELEQGSPHESRDPETGALQLEVEDIPTDDERVVVDEEKNTVTVYGGAEVPVDLPDEVRVIEG